MTAQQTQQTTPAVLRQLQDLTDRAAITSLLDRYQHSLDAGGFDVAWAAAYYTPDARIEVPVGAFEGLAAIARSTTDGVGLFARTQHLAQNYVIDLDGDTATVRADVVNIHVLRGDGAGMFVSGGRNDYALVRTADGWRVREQAMTLTWTHGTPPRLPA